MRKPAARRELNNIVLDSAAVLAFVLAEKGGQKIGVLMDRLDAQEDVKVAISTVNWCEILTRLRRDNEAMTEAELAALLQGVELVPFERADASHAAAFSVADRSLSLGDRACLALAQSRGATAWTADKIWARAKLNVPIEVIR
ncbi:MAG TPA: PIN domain-containing protein [Terracidiphilus sp.]|jgi:PIN domain nuclease of toxin-antitoxin system|nr:PIN domain-containing protein [Terracidiphilus sp.]